MYSFLSIKAKWGTVIFGRWQEIVSEELTREREDHWNGSKAVGSASARALLPRGHRWLELSMARASPTAYRSSMPWKVVHMWSQVCLPNSLAFTHKCFFVSSKGGEKGRDTCLQKEEFNVYQNSKYGLGCVAQWNNTSLTCARNTNQKCNQRRNKSISEV